MEIVLSYRARSLKGQTVGSGKSIHTDKLNDFFKLGLLLKDGHKLGAKVVPLGINVFLKPIL